MKAVYSFFILMLVLTSFSSCFVYQNKWISDDERQSWGQLPNQVHNYVNSEIDNKTVAIAINSPGFSYDYDIGEKDDWYDHQSGAFVLDTIYFHFNGYLKSNKLLTKVTVKDKVGNEFIVPEMDILRMFHRYDTKDGLLFAENIEEEFNRFGFSFRREFGEFKVHMNSGNLDEKEVDKRIIRMGITNNCLEPTKWEVNLNTEDYSDFKSRKKADIYLNEKKTLSHGWFYFDTTLTTLLTNLKNGRSDLDPFYEYEESTKIAEANRVVSQRLRYKDKATYKPRIMEVGHQSNRVLEPVDMEEHYKWEFGIFLNKSRFTNYSNILDEPVKLARFTDNGFYNPETPNVYDYGFMRNIDQIEMRQLSTPNSESYYEFKLTGQYAQYEIILGNVDLSLLNHHKMRAFLFGFNTYPKGRRYNPSQNTNSFDADTYPDRRLQPYLIMVDKNTGNYVNNQKKGVEKLYITYDKSDKRNLIIYLLSYERITPVWMSKFVVPTPVYEQLRIRKNLF